MLDQGLVKEFDSPQALMADKKSIFYSMVKVEGRPLFSRPTTSSDIAF